MALSLSYELLKSDPAPPWQLMSSRALAQAIGVSLQTLANWRVRSTGPRPQPMRRGTGNRIFYRRSDVLEWLSTQLGQPRPAWVHSADWLEKNGLAVEPKDERQTERLIKIVDSLV